MKKCSSVMHQFDLADPVHSLKTSEIVIILIDGKQDFLKNILNLIL